MPNTDTTYSTNFQSGFTLIELMITLVIACILITASVAGFGKNSARRQAAALADELTSSLNLARSEASRTSQIISVHLCGQPQWSYGWKVLLSDNSADPNPDCVNSAKYVQIVAGVKSADVVTGYSNVAKKRIRFFSSGEADTTEVSEIRICAKGETRGYKVTVNSTGSIQKEEFTPSDSTICAP